MLKIIIRTASNIICITRSLAARFVDEELIDAVRRSCRMLTLSIPPKQAVQAARLAAKGAEAQFRVGTRRTSTVPDFTYGFASLVAISNTAIEAFSGASPNLVRKVSTGELDVVLVAAVEIQETQLNRTHLDALLHFHGAGISDGDA